MAAICSALLVSTVLSAQAQTPSASSAGFEKNNYNYSKWTKGLFSEIVTVTHPGKMIFLAGVGAEDESSARGMACRATSRGSAAMPMIRSNGYSQPTAP